MSSSENTSPNEHVGGLSPRSFIGNANDVRFDDFGHTNIPLEPEEWPVIIIGSSMVGMMTGLLLGYHGYNVILLSYYDLKTKELKKYRSKYLVACDGNRSNTRRKEGISFDGVGTLRNSLSIQVAANLSPCLGTRSVYGVIYVNNAEVNGGFRLENQSQNGIAMINRVAGRNDFPAGSVTLEQARQYVQSLSGCQTTLP
ncbi:hypothetical protein E8E11_006214 [Didymella keratinophila]|nr:hypothetical protein E8E11_006214 [Didymella keratinophila]